MIYHTAGQPQTHVLNWERIMYTVLSACWLQVGYNGDRALLQARSRKRIRIVGALHKNE